MNVSISGSYKDFFKFVLKSFKFLVGLRWVWVQATLSECQKTHSTRGGLPNGQHGPKHLGHYLLPPTCVLEDLGLNRELYHMIWGSHPSIKTIWPNVHPSWTDFFVQR